MDQPKDRIREFLCGQVRDRKLLDDEDIFASGFVHSLVATQLVKFIETEFSIFIEDEDLDLHNFRTINAMDGLVRRKLG